MLSIGWRNLKREPLRMVVAICGVVFAVVLVTVEVGMLLGLVKNASLLIDKSNAELWVSTIDVKTFDFATPIEQRKMYLIEPIPGVEKVEEFNVSYSIWKLKSGGNANVQVIAFDPKSELAPQLDLVAGTLEGLHNQDSIIIDEGELGKLDHPKIGDYVEVIGSRAKIVGFTSGIQSFTTTPYVFTSLRRGDRYGWMVSGTARPMSIYFLVKVKPGYDVEEVRENIRAVVPDVEVHTRESFSWRTQRYWMIETGVGMGFLAAAVLGLLVGGVIVSQTLYGMTLEKVREFGVLKALGANMGELSRVVLEQGMICGMLGLVVGLGISHIVSLITESAGTSVLIPWPLALMVALITALLCSGASLVSILRLRRVEPATVFRA